MISIEPLGILRLILSLPAGDAAALRRSGSGAAIDETRG